MIRTCFPILALVLFCSPAFALQSGGLEIGDLETGSVTGQAFKSLNVGQEIGGKNVWYPSTAILNLVSEGTGGRAGRLVLFQVTNKLALDYTFHLSADSAMAGPTSLNTSLILKPGETKYIGVPMSNLTYVTANNLLIYNNPTSKGGLTGHLLVIR